MDPNLLPGVPGELVDYEQIDRSLLPGLPNDVALQCLVRVPRRCHSTLAMVCQQWKEVLHSTEYFSLRKKMSLSEGWVYALIRDSSEVLHWYALDPRERKWRELPPMPGACAQYYGMTSVVLDRQLFVLGGGENYENPTAQVVKYDAVTNKWKEVADMETARSLFVCAAFDGQLYAIGGMGTATAFLNSWEVYDAAGECWSSFDDPNILLPDLVESLVFDRKLYILGIHRWAAMYMYNQGQSSWALVHDEMTKEWVGPTAVAGNDVYKLDCIGLKLTVLNKETLTWDSLGRLPTVSVKPACQIAVVGRNLFVVGTGLRTTVGNLDCTGNVDGVTSPFKWPKDSNNFTLSCHVLEM